jgi:hypothetical protein
VSDLEGARDRSARKRRVEGDPRGATRTGPRSGLAGGTTGRPKHPHSALSRPAEARRPTGRSLPRHALQAAPEGSQSDALDSSRGAPNHARLVYSFCQTRCLDQPVSSCRDRSGRRLIVSDSGRCPHSASSQRGRFFSYLFCRTQPPAAARTHFVGLPPDRRKTRRRRTFFCAPNLRFWPMKRGARTHFVGLGRFRTYFVGLPREPRTHFVGLAYLFCRTSVPILSDSRTYFVGLGYS